MSFSTASDVVSLAIALSKMDTRRRQKTIVILVAMILPCMTPTATCTEGHSLKLAVHLMAEKRSFFHKTDCVTISVYELHSATKWQPLYLGP